jgi:Flp pilus assembly protein TadG
MPRLHRRSRGFALIWFTVLLAALMGLASLAVDYGRVQVVKTQLRRTADAAARYAASGLADGTAVAKAQDAANDNSVDGSLYSMDASDVQTGNWSGGVFTAGGSPTNAVKVTVGCTKARGNAVPLLFAQMLGQKTCDVNASCIATGASAPPYGIIGLSYIKMSGGTNTSYSSASSGGTGEAKIASNGDLTLGGGATIDGNAYAGVGQSVNTGGGAAVTGSKLNLTSTMSYPNASAGQYATTNSNSNIPAMFLNASGNFSMGGSSTLTLPAGNYCVNNFKLSGGAVLSFSGPVTFYVTGTFDVGGGSSINTYNNIPDNFQVKICSTSGVTLSNGAQLYCALYCPQSALKMSGATKIVGGIVAASIDMTGGASSVIDIASTANSTTSGISLVQ